jgi:hypothetical protein
MLGNSSVAAQQAASQEGLSSMALVILFDAIGINMCVVSEELQCSFYPLKSKTKETKAFSNFQVTYSKAKQSSVCFVLLFKK